MNPKSYMLINKDGSIKIIDPIKHSGPYLRIATCLTPWSMKAVAPQTFDGNVTIREETYEMVRFYSNEPTINGFVFYKQI